MALWEQMMYSAQYIAVLRRILDVHGYSRHVVPHPANWPANRHTTGCR
jgi:sterol 3beta-glucosyltransferase